MSQESLLSLASFVSSASTTSTNSNLSGNKRKFEGPPLAELDEYYEYTDATDSVEGVLGCPICYGIFKNPHTHKCGITYCLGCFQKSKNGCPNCRGSSKDIAPNRIVRDLLNALPVKCNNCTTEIRVHEFPVHYNNQCPMKCTNEGCSFVGEGSTALEEHKPQCDSRIVQCPVKILERGCDQLTSSGLKPLAYTCPWRGKRKDYPFHVQECSMHAYLNRENLRAQISRELYTREANLTQAEITNHFQKIGDVPKELLEDPVHNLHKVEHIYWNENRVCIRYRPNQGLSEIHEHIHFADENISTEPLRMAYRLNKHGDIFYIVYNAKSPLNSKLRPFLKPIKDFNTDHEYTEFNKKRNILQIKLAPIRPTVVAGKTEAKSTRLSMQTRAAHT